MSKSQIVPITLKYTDKIEAARKMVTILSSFYVHLSQRNIDLLTICIVEDMNRKDFKDLVISSGIGFKNKTQINTYLTRLKKKGFIYDDPIKNEKHLGKGAKEIADVINSSGSFGLYIEFNKE